MPRSSGGTYTLPAGNPVVTATIISSVWANTTLTDLSNAMTDSLSRSGQGGMTASLALADGAIGAPGLSWGTETTSGLYRAAAGDFRYSISAVDKMQITTNGVRAADGALATPGFSFIADTDTGMYRSGANSIAFASASALRVSISPTELVSRLQIQAIAGLVGGPSYSFENDNNTGIYNSAADALGFATNGVIRFNISTTETLSRLPFQGPLGSQGTPTYSFETDPNTGIYGSGTDGIVFTTGGTARGVMTTTIFDVSGWQIQHGDGSAGTPNLSFLSDTDTGFYRDTANQIAIALAGVTAGQIAQGSFTGTLTGYAANPTGTVNYQRWGNIVFLWTASAIQAVSNAITLTMTGLPASVQPSATSLSEVFDMTDASGTTQAIGSVTGGTITFSKYTGVTARSTNGWTNSGTKGTIGGWHMWYQL